MADNSSFQAGYDNTYRQMAEREIFVSDNKIESDVFRRMLDLASRSSGLGSYFNRIQTQMVALDRYNRGLMAPHQEVSGPIFITRPRLALTSANLRNSDVLRYLDTSDNTSAANMIRRILDPEYSRRNRTGSMIDDNNPFIVPLCNSVISLGGLPDRVNQEYTSQGGLWGENLTTVKGSDDLRGTYNLNLGINEPQGAPVYALLSAMIEFERLVTDGEIFAYKDDIDRREICYTCSIYHFNLDNTHRRITKWVKCTGCFPLSLPDGAMLSVNPGERYVEAASKYSVPWICNRVEYNRPGPLMDFRALMLTFCPSLNDGVVFYRDKSGSPITTSGGKLYTGRWPDKAVDFDYSAHPKLTWTPMDNFRGLPWLENTPQGLQLIWRRVDNPVNPLLGKAGVDITDKLIRIVDGKINQFSEELPAIPTNRYMLQLVSGITEEKVKAKMNDIKSTVSVDEIKTTNDEAPKVTSTSVITTALTAEEANKRMAEQRQEAFDTFKGRIEAKAAKEGRPLTEDEKDRIYRYGIRLGLKVNR